MNLLHIYTREVYSSFSPPAPIMAASILPSAYQPSAASPDWLNKGDNAWQMVSATLVGLQSVPGLVILYGSIVKKKWAVNSAFMALYAFSAVVICWVTWAYKMSFGEKLLPFWGRAGPALGQKFLIKQAALPASEHHYHNGDVCFFFFFLNPYHYLLMSLSYKMSEFLTRHDNIWFIKLYV